MVSIERVGSHTVEIEGIRHLGDHESVVYARHIEDDDDDDADDMFKVTGKTHKPIRQSSAKHVLFSNTEKRASVKSASSDHFHSGVEDDLKNDRDVKPNKVHESSSESGKKSTKKEKIHDSTKLKKDEKVREQKTPKDITKSLELYGLSPRIARRHQQSVSQNKEHEPSHGVHKKHLHHPGLTASIESLGLSPGLRRKVMAGPHNIAAHTPVRVVLPHSLKSNSIDAFSHHSSNSSSSEPSPMQSPNLARKMSMPPTPLHSNFIGSEEELERLRFIKKALSPAPLFPDIHRNRSNTMGNDNYLKPPVAGNGRRRSVSMDPKDSKYRLAKESVKKRVDSAHK